MIVFCTGTPGVIVNSWRIGDTPISIRSLAETAKRERGKLSKRDIATNNLIGEKMTKIKQRAYNTNLNEKIKKVLLKKRRLLRAFMQKLEIPSDGYGDHISIIPCRSLCIWLSRNRESDIINSCEWLWLSRTIDRMIRRIISHFNIQCCCLRKSWCCRICDTC